MHIVFLHISLILFFITIIFLHIAKRNTSVAFAYSAQSFMIAVLLGGAYWETGEGAFLLLALVVCVVKVFLAPFFLLRLVKKYEIDFLVSSYATTPVLLGIVAGLTALAHSDVFLPLVTLVPSYHDFASLALSALFISLFLIVNKKGAISQIVGVLSLENSIVAFSLFSLINQSLALEVGIVFSLLVWIVVATVFTAMIYSHFGSIDVTKMKRLRD